MSDYLVRIIDKSILPASLMVVAKFVGMAIAVNYFDVVWYINYGNGLFDVYPVVDSSSLVLVSSISDIVLLICILAGYSYFVLQAVLFHDTHINPKTVARLVKMNMLSIINNSSKIYFSAGVWGIFSLMSIILVLINIFLNRTYWWIGLIGVIVFIANSIFLVRDIEDEISRARKNLSF